MPKQYLIKDATLNHPGHALHGTKTDILITDGTIAEIGSGLESDAERIEGQDLVVCAAWHDLRCHLADPGHEYKETLSQLCNAAWAGGFASISTLPNTDPVTDHKAGINYIIGASKGQPVRIMPFGALSQGAQGEELAELFDMQANGAVGFTDGDRATGTGLLRKALLYAKAFNGLVVSFPIDPLLHHDGMVNESDNTVGTGLKASPSLAEYSCVRQQLDILEYCSGRLHFSAISCAESVELIRAAKQKGLKVSCGVPIHNLCYTDERIAAFDPDFKLLPVLRTEADRQALIKGVQDGTIDVIVSNHHAQNIERKKVEFDYADTGVISLQLVYPMYRRYLSNELDEDRFMACLGSGPREVLGLEEPRLEAGQKAHLSVFDRQAEWVLDAATNCSGSQNTYLWNKALKGKCLGVFSSYTE